MKRYPSYLTLLLLIIWIAPAIAEDTPAPFSQSDLAALSKKADALIGAMLDSYAVEYKKARVIRRIKMIQQGTNVRGQSYKYEITRTIVLFTIEGFNEGNNYQFYVGLFGDKGENFKLFDVIKIGGEGWRWIDFNSAKINGNNYLEFDIKEYASEDGMCCPSKAGKAWYSIKNDRLTEVESTNSTSN